MIYYRNAGGQQTTTNKTRGVKVYLGDGYDVNTYTYPNRRVRKIYYKTENGVEVVHDSWCLRRYLSCTAWDFDYIPATQYVNEGWIYINSTGFYQFRDGITTKIGNYTARDIYSRCFYAHGAYWAWDRFIYRYPWYPNIPAQLLKWDGFNWVEVKDGTYSVENVISSGNLLYKPEQSGTSAMRVYSGSGNVWTRVALFPTNLGSLISNAGTIYCWGSYGGGSVGVWNGASWTVLPASRWYPIIYDVTNIGGTYYCAASDGLFQWNGSAWVQLTNLRAPSALQVCGVSGKLIYSKKKILNGYGIEAVPQYRRSDGDPEQLDMFGLMFRMRVYGGNLYLSGNAARNVYSAGNNAIYKLTGKLA